MKGTQTKTRSLQSNRPKKNHSQQRRVNQKALHQSSAQWQEKNAVRSASVREQNDFSGTYRSKVKSEKESNNCSTMMMRR